MVPRRVSPRRSTERAPPPHSLHGRQCREPRYTPERMKLSERLGKSEYAPTLCATCSTLHRTSTLPATLGPVTDIEGKTQARMALYTAGRIDQEYRWPEFESWFIDVGDRMRSALASIPELRQLW